MALIPENQDLAEEIEAVNAIYEPDTITVTRTTPANATTKNTLDLGSPAHTSSNIHTTVVTLQIPEQQHLSFILGFEASYPDSRPAVLGTASTAARGEGKIAIDVLEDIVQRTWQAGAVCLFDVISEAVDIFPELSIGQDDAGDSSTQTPTIDASTATDAFEALSLRDAFGIDAPPEWILSDVVSEKKSVFVGRVARVTCLAQAQAFIDHLTATDRKVAAATHNISAWRIRQKKAGDGEGETVVQDYDDDGETAAGGRLLHVMQLMDVWNVVVVVTRWYGGIQLGPARFRLINDVGRDALVKGGFTKEKEEAAGAEKGKKKGKK